VSKNSLVLRASVPGSDKARTGSFRELGMDDADRPSFALMSYGGHKFLTPTFETKYQRPER